MQGALAKLNRRWQKVDDPEGHVRRIIYNDQVNRWQRLPVLREEPVDAVPDGALPDRVAGVEDRLDVWELLVDVAGVPGLLSEHAGGWTLVWQPDPASTATLMGIVDAEELLAIARTVAPVPADDPRLTSVWWAG